MFRTITLTLTACGVVVVSAAIPHTGAAGADVSFNEPSSMLLLATVLFGLAAVVRRRGKAPRPPAGVLPDNPQDRL